MKLTNGYSVEEAAVPVGSRFRGVYTLRPKHGRAIIGETPDTFATEDEAILAAKQQGSEHASQLPRSLSNFGAGKPHQ